MPVDLLDDLRHPRYEIRLSGVAQLGQLLQQSHRGRALAAFGQLSQLVETDYDLRVRLAAKQCLDQFEQVDPERQVREKGAIEEQRMARDKAEAERQERERAEAAERERNAREQADADRQAREKAQAEREASEKAAVAERERTAGEKAAAVEREGTAVGLRGWLGTVLAIGLVFLFLLYQTNFSFKLAAVNVLQGVLGLLLIGISWFVIAATSGMPFVRRWTLRVVLFVIVVVTAVFLAHSFPSIFS